MDTSQIVTLASELIRFRSLSGEEVEITNFLADQFRSRGWDPEVLPVEGLRSNLFVAFGNPKIVFTTHTDVVPGPDDLFVPKVRDGRLYGRGACDTKGIIATMIAVAESLLSRGERDFGLLFVVGEELDGIGARKAAEQLKDRGVRYLINGEPTECKVMRAHKGGLALNISCQGTACHSGYPEVGDDANVKLLRVLAQIIEASWPSDPVLGSTTVNCGLIQGGVAGNIVSPRAEACILFRTVSSNEKIRSRVAQLLPPLCELNVSYDAPAVSLLEIPGLASDVASYCTDIPNFAALDASCVLYGPGTILAAHTDEEYIGLKDIEEALIGYDHIFHQLKHGDHR